MSTLQSAIEAAQDISAMVPTKPKGSLFLKGEAAAEFRSDNQAYGVLAAAELAAWRYVGHLAVELARGGEDSESGYHISASEAHALVDTLGPDVLKVAAADPERFEWPARRLDQA